MYYLKYFTGHIFILLEVLFLYRKRNDLDTGRKIILPEKKHYFTWHLICRRFKHHVFDNLIQINLKATMLTMIKPQLTKLGDVK